MNGPEGFDALVLVAPAHSLEAIEGALDSAVAAKLTGTVSKDLIKVPDDELWPHLRAFVPAPAPKRHL